MGQEETFVFGQLTDENNTPIFGVNIYDVDSLQRGTASDVNGEYRLDLPPNQSITLRFSIVGSKPYEQTFTLKIGQQLLNNVILEAEGVILEGVEVSEETSGASTVQKISLQGIEELPTTTMNIEDIIKTMKGVSSNNELSSTYSVRGGNYDENLVYVNDYEIFRPFLIRSGQQEGLSFVNPDLVGSLGFSAGGFAPKYGDKMSSVLDVKYKRPNQFAGSLAMSLLGLSGHIEGKASNRFRYMLGVRHKSNAYLLNAIPVDGDYIPSFTDIQAYFTYDLTANIQLDFIGNFARNRFTFVPESRDNNFGSRYNAFKLSVAYDGSEEDAYQTGMGGMGLSWFSDNGKTRLKLMASGFNTKETEAFDILGNYNLSAVGTSGINLGEITDTLATGMVHSFAENHLNAEIYNIAHRGYWTLDRRNRTDGEVAYYNQHFFTWGVKYQREEIVDQLNQWERKGTVDEVDFYYALQTELANASNRYTAFLQDEWTIGREGSFSMLGGIRAQYWDTNKEFLFSPRLQIAYRPLKWMERMNSEERALERVAKKQGKGKEITAQKQERDLVIRLATGAYYQPPFYREMRNRQGELNKALLAQKSFHALLGLDYIFSAWNRPFKFSVEAYYKYLWDLVPYDMENLLIRYFANNEAKGYAAGVDLRLNGEFVPGRDSWISLSIMQTKEDLKDDHYYDYLNATDQNIYENGVVDQIIVDSARMDIGPLLRPTNEHVRLSFFFQDYFPNNKNIKSHFMFVFGSGMRHGPAGIPELRNKRKFPTYRRADLGLSARLLDKNKSNSRVSPTNPLRFFDNIWVSLEVLNVLGATNTISYNYFKARSFESPQEIIYNVPNYLTARRLNARLKVNF